MNFARVWTLAALGLVVSVSALPTTAMADQVVADQVVADLAKAKRPNVLFILTEDQGAHLSLLGTPGLKTPHIDQLARSGTYFDQAFVAYPVCSASKAALYTGLYGHTNGILNNTHNFHKPASEVTQGERNLKLARTNRIKDRFTTLTQILGDNGYFQGVTHKLHVLPNEKFPYDRWMQGTRQEVKQFISDAATRDQPWFLMVNIPDSHRPYPNSDKKAIRVDPDSVKVPPYLPDSPTVRKDWAEYLAGIERADALTGQTLEVLRQSGQADNTIVVFMSDHGPTFQHGKMTLYDLGLRVPLVLRGPGIKADVRSDALVSEVDLFPTLLDLCGLPAPSRYAIDGKSLASVLVDPAAGDGASASQRETSGESSKREYVFAEISNRGPLPNDGIQERSVFDGRWKLIYRENVEKQWRQVNDDSRQFKDWGNRTYAETIRLKDQFPRQYEILAQMDPQRLGGKVPGLELYNLDDDPHEMNNLAGDAESLRHQDRLLGVLSRWVERTRDVAITNLKVGSQASQPPDTSTHPAVRPNAPSPSSTDVDVNRSKTRKTFPVVKSKKGLQVEIPRDAVDLGVKHAVFNFDLTSLLLVSDPKHAVTWVSKGRSYQFNKNYLRRLDKDIKLLSDSGAVVYLVMLVYRSGNARQADVLLHPEYDLKAPNRISAFNTVTSEGRDTFSAAMEFIADRYSGDNTRHGQVAGYIIGNEVNSHWWWSNRGEVTMDGFISDYADAVALADHAVRGVSNWARLYVSLDHHWTTRISKDNPLRSFGAKEFLLRFSAAMQQRGVDRWHLAFHPYPENLFNPKFWEDKTATSDDETLRVTLKNLEVLTAFVRRPDMLLEGQPRSIILSEQGFHTGDGLQGELLQAAAYCYAYRKIEALPEIDAFILHRHVDHPREGGLNLGLRRYDPKNRLTPAKKYIYDVFLNSDQDDWHLLYDFALPIIGLDAWP